MKLKNNMPLSKWLWMFGIYIVSSVIGVVICTTLVNGGNTTLDGCKIAVAVVTFISGVLMGLLAKNLPIIGICIPAGIMILLNAACALLVFAGIGNGFLIQNGALILGGLLGFWIINKSGRTPKGKRRRKYSG